jgi:predicted unusual protein kinase regulating ubiquinone biosynthesis (AarF/ABC1/UbiB family)
VHDELPAPSGADASHTQDGIAQGRLRRVAPLVGLTARTAGEALLVGARSRLTGADATAFHIRTAERYVELLGRSKGALMKAGQMLSLTPVGPAVPADLRDIYQAALARLRSDVPPMAPELARAVLERELGRSPESAFDYQHEAANQIEFARHYRGHPFIRVPEIVEELSSARVLTQELVRGLSWSDALAADQELRDSWAEAIHRFVYGSYNRFCMFNADPHPGNYVFQLDGSVSCLDFGCVKRLRRDQVQMMDAVVAAALRHDVLGTWRASVEAGFWRASDPVTCEEVFDYWYDDWAMMWAEERFVVTPEYVASWFGRKLSPSGPSANACSYITVPPEYAMIGRVELGVAAIAAQLRAGNVWGAMAAERFWDAEPQTELGKLERAFFDERQVAGHA